MRAKPKPFDPLFWPELKPVTWSTKDEQLLIEDLDLDAKKHKTECRQMLDTLSRRIGSYHAWGAFDKTRPTRANHLAELKALGPKIKQAFLALRDLSVLARLKIKNAYVEGMGQREFTIADQKKSSQINRAIDSAQNDLCDLTLAIEQAIKNLSTERRGRPPQPVHVLIKQLAAIFAQYDQADHDNETARRSACEAFVRHTLKAAKLAAPKRLAPYLSQQ